VTLDDWPSSFVAAKRVFGSRRILQHDYETVMQEQIDSMPKQLTRVQAVEVIVWEET